MKKKRKQHKVLDEIVYRLVLFAVWIIRCCSLKTAYAIARFCGTMFYVFDVRHRKRTIRHILHSGVRTDEAEAKKLARANLIHLVKVFVEIVKFDQIVNEQNFHEHIFVDDSPAAQRFFNKETTCQTILATSHLGNWELAGGSHTFLTGMAMTSIMRPLNNPKLGDFIYKHRCRWKHKTVSRENGIRPLLVAHRDGDNITIVADQHAGEHEGVEVTFFGHPARTHATPALLHLKTGTPIVSPYLVRMDDDFHFKFFCPEPIVYKPTGDSKADVQAICQQYTTLIEKGVRNFPEQWLWAHRRWLDIERGHDAEYKNGKRIIPAEEAKK